MRKQYTAYLFLCCSLSALLLGLSGPGVALAKGQTRLTSLHKAASQTCGSWSVVTSPNGSSSNNFLNGVAAVSANDVWAVGSSLDISTDTNQTLIEQWNGTSWSIVASPNVGSDPSLLTNVAVVSASDVWAVGYYYNIKNNRERTLIEQWNGTSWSVVTSPDIGTNNNSLAGVAVVSASDIWAVGEYYDNATGDTRTLTLHWNGTSWSIVPSPNTTSTINELNGVTAISTSDVWAVGDYYKSTTMTDRTLTLHWNGTKWNPVASPSSGYLNGVTAVSTSDVWAVGSQIEQWNGTSWSVVSSPNSGELNGVAAVSANDIWAVGYYENNDSDLTSTLQWNGTSWSLVSSPNVGGNDILHGVAAVSINDVWAVGYTNQTLIEFYC